MGFLVIWENAVFSDTEMAGVDQFIVVSLGFAQQTFIPYSATFGSSFRQGLVKQVNTDTGVVILDGEQVKTCMGVPL